MGWKPSNKRDIKSFQFSERI